MAHYQRLRDLREDADKTHQEIADYLGTSAQHYGKYESGKAEIPLERAVLLAKYYNVSLDYIPYGRFREVEVIRLSGRGIYACRAGGAIG